MPMEHYERLKAKYEKIHPLIVVRTLEKSVSVEEAERILDSFPGYPAEWSEEEREWKRGAITG